MFLLGIRLTDAHTQHILIAQLGVRDEHLTRRIDPVENRFVFLVATLVSETNDVQQSRRHKLKIKYQTPLPTARKLLCPARSVQRRCDTATLPRRSDATRTTASANGIVGPTAHAGRDSR